MRKHLFLLVFLLFGQNLYSQYKGDVVFTVSVGLPKFSCMSLRYYPVNNFALGLQAGGIPHIFNYGIGFIFHLKKEKPNTTVSFEISKMDGWKSQFFKDSLNTDKTVVIRTSTLGINFGIGREFNAGENPGFFSMGPTYIIECRKYTYNPKLGESSYVVPFSKWFGFIEGGIIYTKRK